MSQQSSIRKHRVFIARAMKKAVPKVLKQTAASSPKPKSQKSVVKHGSAASSWAKHGSAASSSGVATHADHLPDDAPILFFSGSKGLLEKQLSNFYPSPVEYRSRPFPTVEHAFYAVTK